MSAFTKQAIRQAFIKLLQERPVSRITIRDIAEECGINRNTFYYHYSDLPALIEEIITEKADRIVKQYNNPSSIEECVQVIVKELMQNKKAVLHLHQSSSRIVYEQYLWKLCTYVVSNFMENIFQEFPLEESQKTSLINFYKCACFGQLIEWLDSGMRLDILSDVHNLCELKRGISVEMLRRTYGKNQTN